MTETNSPPPGEPVKVAEIPTTLHPRASFTLSGETSLEPSGLGEINSLTMMFKTGNFASSSIGGALDCDMLAGVVRAAVELAFPLTRRLVKGVA